MVCETESEQEVVVQNRKLSSVLCDDLEGVGCGVGERDSRERDTWGKEHGPGHPESRTGWTVFRWERLVGKGVAGSQGSSGERGYQPRLEFWGEGGHEGIWEAECHHR